MSQWRRINAFILVLLVGISAPAVAEAQDAKFRADVEKLLEVTGSASLGAHIATLFSNQTIDGMKKEHPDIPDRALVLVKDTLSAEFVKAFQGPEGLTPKLVDIYMRHFTHEEVIALVNFYSTDLGRKTISVLPKLAQDAMVVAQQWAEANLPRIGEAVREKLRAEGFIK